MNQRALLKYLLWLWCAIALAACVVSAWFHQQIGLNNDNLTLVDQTRKMLAGAVPYVDYTDVTPPLTHLLFIAPILFAKFMGLSDDSALNGMMLLITLLAIAVCSRILRYGNSSHTIRAIALSAIGLALFVPSFTHQSFAERDWMMLALATPWLLLYSPLAERSAVPQRWRICTAVMAAIGFAIKPYFYVFYITPLIFSWLRGEQVFSFLRQVEHRIVLGFGIMYLIAVFVFFPAYPLTMIPLGWATYGTIAWSLDGKLTIIRELFTIYGIFGLAAALLLGAATSRRYDRTILYLIMLLAACVVSYMLNGGWYYTQYPFIAIATVLAIATGSRLLEAALQLQHPRQRIVAVPSVLLILGVAGWYMSGPAISRAQWDLGVQSSRGHPVERGEMEQQAWQQIEPMLDAHPRFMLFSTNLWAVTMLKPGTDRINVGRFDYFWPLPGILRMQGQAGKEQQYASLSRYIIDSVTDDLKRHAPAMVINDISPYQRNLPVSYNMIPFLLQSPEFAEEWNHYAMSAYVNTCTPSEPANCAYVIYYRK